VNAKRRTLADVVGPVALEHPQIPERPPRPPARRDTPAEPSAAAAASPDPDPAEAPPRPSARDLVTPRRDQVAREALKADVPAELALLQRLRRYRLDTGTDIRDQVAMAVDEWLTSQGY
jgi:hypothetical protein